MNTDKIWDAFFTCYIILTIPFVLLCIYMITCIAGGLMVDKKSVVIEGMDGHIVHTQTIDPLFKYFKNTEEELVPNEMTDE